MQSVGEVGLQQENIQKKVGAVVGHWAVCLKIPFIMSWECPGLALTFFSHSDKSVQLLHQTVLK